MRRLWLDLETRSLLNIKNVGLDRYGKDKTTQVLMLAWAFDYDKPRLWLPCLGEPMPPELHAGLIDPTVLKCAWNFNFEKDILHFQLGIAIPLVEWYDPATLCAYMSLPIGLDRAGSALDIDTKKIHITGDTRPVKMFSNPSKQLKRVLKKDLTAPAFYFKDWNSHPEDWAIFCAYCIQDVEAERGVWEAAVAFNSPMTPGEKQAWLLDQRMNDNGVWIDMQYVLNAMKVAKGESDQIIEEMKLETGLENPNSRDQMLEWLQARKYPFDSIDVEHIEEALKLPFLPPLAVKILKLKQKLGGSAYKKLQSILDRVGPDGRLRDQFTYHGAHTGRWSGRGVQLQNLYKPDREVSRALNQLVVAIRQDSLNIPNVITAYDAEIDLWNAANPAEKPQKHLDPKPFTPMEVVASTIRAAFSAAPGNKLVVGDLAQIESRVLAAIAQCNSMISAYAEGRDLYKEVMAAQLGIPLSEVTKSHRDRGKVIILGCFGGNTPVLTKRGWIPLTQVLRTDSVFDGVGWVTHEGVIAQGRRGVIDLRGVEVTPDHLVRTGENEWRESWHLKENTQYAQQALNLAIGSLSNISAIDTPRISANANPVGVSNPLISITSNGDEQNLVSLVQTPDFVRNKMASISDFRSTDGNTLTDWRTATMRFLAAVVERDTERLATMDEESKANFWMSMTLSDIVSRSMGGTNPNSKSTVSTTTETMSKEISDSSRTKPIYETEVFDILNAGPRNRFMILTLSGPMIVHNCGYGMGWEKFIEYAATYGIVLTEKEAKDAVWGFRDTYKEIVDFWGEINQAVITAFKAGICVYVRGLVVDGRDEKCLKIKLPSGRYIHYHKPTLLFEPPPWGGPPKESISFVMYGSKGAEQKRLYGGLLTENIVQAVARDLLLNGMLEAEKLGFKIILTIHDEIAGEVPIDSPLGEKDLLAAMCIVPEWGEGMGFVLKAEGYENQYYKK